MDVHPGRFEYRHDFPPLQTPRQVLYLGEINDSQKAAWCRTIKVLYEDGTGAAQVPLFPEDRVAPELDCDVVRVRLKRLWCRLGELAHQIEPARICPQHSSPEFKPRRTSCGRFTEKRASDYFQPKVQQQHGPYYFYRVGHTMRLK